MRETKLAIWEETISPHFSYSFKDTFMHKIKKQQQQTFFFNNFLIIFYCLSLIQTLKYEDKKLDLNNASYTNTHAEEREREKILPGAGNRIRIEAFTPHQVCLSFRTLHHSTILPTVILFFTEVYHAGAGIENTL